jgi:hypothetical protein
MSRPSTLGSIISSQVRCWEIMIVCFDTNASRSGVGLEFTCVTQVVGTFRMMI